MRADNPRSMLYLRFKYRLKGPEAQNVQVQVGKCFDSVQNLDGVWSVTTEPILPGFHPYSFVIDGVAVNYPASETFFTTGRWISGIEIPEHGVDFYHIKDVPHGDIRRVHYLTKESGKWRRLFTYTPF